jgi:PAS domain S-box-containing protein
MQLRRNRRRLEQAQAIAHMGNWDWDVRANRLTWSEELCRIYGVEPSDCPATFEGYLERVHPDDRERVQATIERALVDRQPFEFDERIVRPNGGIHLLESHGEVHTNADGQVVRVIGVSQDVTTRRPSGSRV